MSYFNFILILIVGLFSVGLVQTEGPVLSNSPALLESSSISDLAKNDYNTKLQKIPLRISKDIEMFNDTNTFFSDWCINSFTWRRFQSRDSVSYSQVFNDFGRPTHCTHPL